VEDFGREKGSENFVDNDVRGHSYFFTYQAACTFLERNRLLSIIRSHQAQDDMYRLFPWGQWLSMYTVTACTGKLARLVSQP